MSRFHVDTAIRGCLVGAIAQARGNMRRVAELTGLSRATCYRLFKKYGIDLKGYRANARAELGRDNG